VKNGDKGQSQLSVSEITFLQNKPYPPNSHLTILTIACLNSTEGFGFTQNTPQLSILSGLQAVVAIISSDMASGMYLAHR